MKRYSSFVVSMRSGCGEVSVPGGAYVTSMASPRIVGLGIEARDKQRNPTPNDNPQAIWYLWM